MLSALAPESLARMRFPLGELQQDQVRELAERAGLAVAGRRDSQDLCFLAGTRHGASSSATAASAGAPGRSSTRRSGARRARRAHVLTVGQRHGLGISAPEPLYVLATDARANTVMVGPAARCWRASCRCARLTLLRDGAAWTACACARTGGASRAACPASPAPGAHARRGVELEQPAERTAPGQIACLYAGELVVGHATIACRAALPAPSRRPTSLRSCTMMTSDEIRERYLSFFEERGHRASPRPRWCPPRTTPRRC